MNASIQCELKGAYKVDLYSGGGPNRQFVSSTDWFHNDITNLGLNYPYVFSFADCFRFLSLGAGAWGTNRYEKTGLNTPLTGFQVYNTSSGVHAQSGQYIGWQGYEIGGPHNENFAASIASACGTKFTNKGIDLHRGWTVPTGVIEDGTVLNEPLTIQSFMVSPGSGANTTGQRAFSLIDRTITIPSGFTATVTYQLSINFDNYQNAKYFSGVQGDANGYFNTGNASTGLNGSENGLLSGWSKLSGIFRQVLPGLQVVDRLGASIIPMWGDQLEPKYTDSKKLYFYLSPDISQFAVSPFGAAMNTEITESGAYNSDGLMANYTRFANAINGDLDIDSTEDGVFPTEPNKWYYSGDSQLEATTNLIAQLPSNIRLENLLSVANYASGELDIDEYNYQVKGYVSPFRKNWPTALATPGKSKLDTTNYPDYGQKAVYSTYLKRGPTSGYSSPTGAGGVSNRSKKVTRRGIFSPIQSLGYNTRFGTLTLAYLASQGQIGDLTFYPYADFLFFDTSGAAANMSHYRYIPEIYLAERGSGVSSVVFSIVDNTSSQPSSIKRFYNATGFMGSGINTSSENTSGIQTSHPLLNNPTPPKSGYLFSGKELSSSTLGDMNAFNEVGWGAVYGVIATPSFWSHPTDVCLIAHKPWDNNGMFTGFSGDNGDKSYPNSTGDQSKLFWPIESKTLSISISKIGYYNKIVGKTIHDPTALFDGAKTWAFDIRYSGTSMDTATTRSITDFTGEYGQFQGTDEKIVFYTSTLTQNTFLTPAAFTGVPSLNLTWTVNGVTLTIPFKTGMHPVWQNGYSDWATLSGFDPSMALTALGSGQTFTPAHFQAATNTKMTAGFAGGQTIKLAFYKNGTAYALDTAAQFKLLPSYYKAPSGRIRHVEAINTEIGNRLLPNYGIPNNSNVNAYQPATGGGFPGMSMENGMHIFCDFTWQGG